MTETLATELRRIAEEFREIAADIGDAEPATRRDQIQQTASERAYREAAHRLDQRAATVGGQKGK